MDNVTIPPEVVEAMAIDLYQSVYPAPHYSPWSQIPEWMRDLWRNNAFAAARAMLAAWPGIKRDPWWDLMTHKRRLRLILPIPQEASNG